MTRMGDETERAFPVPLLAPAKINWTLHVLGRRADGFHEIDTVMQTIDLADELVLQEDSADKATGGEAEFRLLVERSDPALPDVPSGADNLVAKAWRLMRDEFGEAVGPVRASLRKGIPSGAGLGGGSSDAAATLVGLASLFGLYVSEERLSALAAKLGSDVPFVLRGGLARATGRGEIVRPLPCPVRATAIHLVVVWPGFESPTGAAYAALDPARFSSRERAEENAAALREGLASGDASALRAALFNAFDEALVPRDARYRETKRAMEEAGLERPMLSGSGSAIYAAADDAESAERARGRLAGRVPFVRVCRVTRG